MLTHTIFDKSQTKPKVCTIYAYNNLGIVDSIVGIQFLIPKKLLLQVLYSHKWFTCAIAKKRVMFLRDVVGTCVCSLNLHDT